MLILKAIKKSLTEQMNCGGLKSASSTAHFLLYGIENVSLAEANLQQVRELIEIVEFLFPYQAAMSIEEHGAWEAESLVEETANSYDLLDKLYRKCFELLEPQDAAIQQSRQEIRNETFAQQKNAEATIVEKIISVLQENIYQVDEVDEEVLLGLKRDLLMVIVQGIMSGEVKVSREVGKKMLVQLCNANFYTPR